MDRIEKTLKVLGATQQGKFVWFLPRAQETVGPMLGGPDGMRVYQEALFINECKLFLREMGVASFHLSFIGAVLLSVGLGYCAQRYTFRGMTESEAWAEATLSLADTFAPAVSVDDAPGPTTSEEKESK